MTDAPDQIGTQSDQQLVDLYAVTAPTVADAPSPDELMLVCEIAHELESRGYVEQAGIWRHPQKRSLQAVR